MKKSSKIFGFLLIIMLILAYASLFLPWMPYIFAHFVPQIPEEYTNTFRQEIGMDVEINQGLQLKPHSGNWEKGTFSILDVVNTSEESIFFEKRDFNLIVYWPDEENGTWSILIRQIHFAEGEIILSPQKPEEKVPLENTIFLEGDDFEDIPNSELRIYIEGKGVVTHKVYGAYIDITLLKPVFE